MKIIPVFIGDLKLIIKIIKITKYKYTININEILSKIVANFIISKLIHFIHQLKQQSNNIFHNIYKIAYINSFSIIYQQSN